MPRDLPGFYFDAEKNRYFPIKGPIPGSSRNSSTASTSSSSTKAANSVFKPKLVRCGLKPSQLLQARELYGSVITYSRRRCNFKEEYQKIQASQPKVWKYQLTRGAEVGLEHIRVNVQTPHGLVGTDSLLGGCMDGSLSVFEVGEVGEQSGFGIKCMSDCVWPLDKGKQKMLFKAPGYLWKRAYALINTSSNISCMKKSEKHSNIDSSPHLQHVVVTTLGSEASGGSIYTLNLHEPFDYTSSLDTLRRRLREVTSFRCTVWSADCSTDGSQAVVGTNFGTAVVDLETGVPSWVLHCKSDILSLQLSHLGKSILCGLRNGAIVRVDARQKSQRSSNRFSRHQIPFPLHGNRTARSSTNRWFELYDQYFLASSMNGSIRLYDHRLIQRGPVQSYEGNVNSHTRIQLGVDPYERIVMSGGEDCSLRLWSIKSGELLFENKFMAHVPSAVCWPKGVIYDLDHNSGAWLGSQEGIYYVHS